MESYILGRCLPSRVKLCTRLAKNILICKRTVSLPTYPPILDESDQGKILRKKKEWRDFIRLLPTVEEKLLHMLELENKGLDLTNILSKKIIGFMLNGVSTNYNSLPLHQHCTRTHLIRGLPSFYTDTNVDVVYENLKSHLIDVVNFAYDQHSHRPPDAKPLSPGEEDQQIAHRVLDGVFRVLLSSLSKDFPHLTSAQVDIDPRCEASWTAGGFDVLHDEKKDKPNETLRNNYFFYSGKPHYQIRTIDPLQPFVTLDDELCTKSDIPSFPYDPSVIGVETEKKHFTLLPGCWPNKRSGFGHSSFHSLEDLHHRRNKFGIVDENECISEFGIIASFGWLMGIATLQGFSPWNDITYPFTTQTIITDGRRWNFYAYQLNTTCLFNENEKDSLRNLCWESGSIDLFDRIENGQMKGLNDDVFKLLIKVLTRVPNADSKNLTPYLKSDIENENWTNIDKYLKLYYSQIPMKRLMKEYEFLWEKIYLENDAYISVNPNRKRKKKYIIDY